MALRIGVVPLRKVFHKKRCTPAHRYCTLAQGCQQKTTDPAHRCGTLAQVLQQKQGGLGAYMWIHICVIHTYNKYIPYDIRVV